MTSEEAYPEIVWDGDKEVEVKNATVATYALKLNDETITRQYYMEDLMDTTILQLDYIFLNKNLIPDNEGNVDITLRIPIPILNYNGIQCRFYINSSAKDAGSTWRLNGFPTGIEYRFEYKTSIMIQDISYQVFETTLPSFDKTYSSCELSMHFKFSNFSEIYSAARHVYAEGDTTSVITSSLSLSFTTNNNFYFNSLYTMKWEDKTLRIPSLSTASITVNDKGITLPEHPMTKYNSNINITNIIYGLRNLLENTSYVLEHEGNLRVRIPFSFNAHTAYAFYFDYELLDPNLSEQEETQSALVYEGDARTEYGNQFNLRGIYGELYSTKSDNSLYIQIPNDPTKSSKIKFSLTFALIREIARY